MKYRIWNHERAMWWKPGQNGYTANIDEAGLYPPTAALGIAREANVQVSGTRQPEETLYPVADTQDLKFRAEYMGGRADDPWIGSISVLAPSFEQAYHKVKNLLLGTGAELLSMEDAD